MKFRKNIIGITAIFFILALSACGDQSHFQSSSSKNLTQEDEDPDLFDDSFVTPYACQKASSSQVIVVNQGNTKKNAFLQQCSQLTGGSAWCNQLVRPNPDSISIFRCTYGSSQVHQLINPDQNSWRHAFNAVRLVQELEQKGFRVQVIYNWWRPEPYNKNVGGASGRHPHGGSVDVRFFTNSEANRAFDELCKYRKQGRIRAIGHYGTNALHFGMGDSAGNTWGRSCP